MDYVCIALVVCNTVGGTFLVCGLHKLEFKMCLDSWFAWRLALDSVEQSQNSSVIIGLGQERYVEKPITYFPLQVSISDTMYNHWVPKTTSQSLKVNTIKSTTKVMPCIFKGTSLTSSFCS